MTIVVLSPDDAPWIWEQPKTQAVVAGQPVELLVYAATVGSQLTYQWRKDEVPLAGETNHRYFKAIAGSGDAGNYTVAVTNSKGTVVSQAAGISLASTGSGADPTAEFVFPIMVTKPGITAPFQIPQQVTITAPVTAMVAPPGIPAGTLNTATVGDTINIRIRAADINGDLFSRILRVFVPDVADETQQRGMWSWDANTYWVDPYKNRGTGNDMIDLFPQNGDTMNPQDRDLTFVLDAPGIWKFQVESQDLRAGFSGVSSRNFLQLEVKNPVLTKNTAPLAGQAGRLVGAYFNPSQNHRRYREMWRPTAGRWLFKWGQNPVLPLFVDWTTPTNPGKFRLRELAGYNYQLGWAVNLNETPAQDANYARDFAAELAYCGIDFVILDHTNLLFTYGPNAQANELGFTNIDNEMMRAATALKAGFANYASYPSSAPNTNNPRVRMTFMLGLTTAWYDKRMDTGHPALVLPIDRRTYRPGQPGEIVWDDPEIDGYLVRQTSEFNAVLQKIWDEFADPVANPGVWQTDPDNQNKPLLLLYVGTDGPAIFRRPQDGMLDGTIPFSSTNALRWEIRRNGTMTPIDQVFSIKYVAAGMASGWAWDDPYWDRNQSPPVPKAGAQPFRERVSEDWVGADGVTRRFYTSHWSFRELPEALATAPVGTLNQGKTGVEAIHVTAYRAAGESLIQSQMQVAVTLKPRFLILTAWNEFGSASDEPTPDDSWTLMPNNKYGRHYSEIVREKVRDYKQASP